ncbi:MAG: dTDP-glucose 4,6-dehydratase [Nanoarchaeota archaeon]
MKLLVTGGAGFIGSNFIRHILKKYPDYKVINFDKLTYAGNLDNLKDIENNPNYTFVRGDVCNYDHLDHVMKEVDSIVHFAAESHVDNSLTSSLIFTQSNTKGTHVLLEVARKHKINRIIHISTDEIYGSTVKGSFKETDHMRPNNPYSAAKAAACLIVRAYVQTFKLPIIITRSSNNFGPYHHPEKLIPKTITNLLENKKVPLYGTGENVRDWLYVLDNCRAIDLVLHKGNVGETYNIGGGNEIENITIIKKILKLLNKDESYIEYVEDRLGHDFRYSLDISKIKNELGWQPKYSFDEALKETVEWYKNNQDWWRKLT